MRNLAQFLVVICLSVPATFLAFIGFQRYDDEGLFLYMQSASMRGSLPYRDYLLEYGPVFHWLNSLYFESVGISHVASRWGVVGLVLATSWLILLIANHCSRNNLFFGPMAAASWLYAASPYLCESLHPGWYIAFAQSLQALLLLKTPSARVMLLQGVLSAIVLGLKPHLGVLSGTVLLSYYALTLNCLRLGRMVAVVFAIGIVTIISPHAWSYGVSFASLLSLFPFIVIAFIPAVIAFRFKIESDGSHDRGGSGRSSVVDFPRHPRKAYQLLTTFVGSGMVATAVLYIPAIFHYGFSGMILSLFQQPAKLYYRIYSTPVPFAPEEMLLFSLSFLLLAASFLPMRHTSILRYGAIAISAVLCAGGTPGNVLGWSIVYLLVLSFVYEMREYRGLLLFCCSQLIHAFSLPAAQTHYATAVAWVLLLGLIHLLITKLSSNFVKLGRLIAVLPLLLLLPLARPAIWKISEYRVWEVACELGFLNSIVVEKPYAEEVCALSQYLMKNSTSDERVATIPGFFSLLLLIDRQSPGDIPAARWSYLPEEYLNRVLAELNTTVFAVVHPANERLYLEDEASAPDGFDTRLLEFVRRDFTLLSGEEWLGRPAKFFQLYRNKREVGEVQNVGDLSPEGGRETLLFSEAR